MKLHTLPWHVNVSDQAPEPYRPRSSPNTLRTKYRPHCKHCQTPCGREEPSPESALFHCLGAAIVLKFETVPAKFKSLSNHVRYEWYLLNRQRLDYLILQIASMSLHCWYRVRKLVSPRLSTTHRI